MPPLECRNMFFESDSWQSLPSTVLSMGPTKIIPSMSLKLFIKKLSCPEHKHSFECNFVSCYEEPFRRTYLLVREKV